MSTPQTPRATRSSVLGKRSQSDCSSVSSTCEQVQTPETPTHKRIKISSTTVDGDANKENIAPFSISSSVVESSPVTPRTTRSLRRNATDTMVTPTRPRIQRNVSLSPTTPATAISQITLATPPPTPSLLLPIHARVRALLRPTCNDIHQLPGRESERAVITEFMNSFLGVCDDTVTEADSANTSTLFVSGTPGTGKTALITDIVQSLDQKTDTLRVLVVNCMALNGMDALWERLLEDLQSVRKGRSKKPKVKGREGVEEVLKGLKTKCIVVLDELDHIASTSQSLSQLFSLTTSHGNNLRIIGIANTHTLTSSPASIPEDVQTLHFAPYTSAQLEQILRSRLSSLHSEDSESFRKFLPNPTITLLAKKVASLTGDVRALLEVLRGAIDLAVKPKADADVLVAPSYTVSPAHVLSALKAYKPSSSTTTNASSHTVVGSQPSSNSNSEIVVKTRALSFQSRLVLLSILLASKRVEAGLSLTSSSAPSASPVKRSNSSPSFNKKDLSLDVSQLHSYHSLMLTRETNDSISSTVSRTEFGDLLVMLEGVGLVSLPSSGPSSPTKPKTKARFSRTTSFGGSKAGGPSGEVKLNTGVWVDEVLRGLGVGMSSTDIREEEINALWVRESGKIAKDLKSVRAKARKEECGVGFADAMED
ncbi:AAA ATPase [Marasmius tenuissimus]|uniref:AAA ATPase n=1 Tax=Marasmius tenuissimus TaxID=585030 RepID=A0ABR2ZMV4_9AGAR